MTRSRRSALFALVVAVALALGGCTSSDGSGGGSGSSGSSGSSAHNDADATFAAEMVPHHEQALQMVAMTQGRDLSPDFEQLTTNIYDAQQPEIDEMKGWLEDWGEPTATGTGMGGMGNMSEMPGMDGSAPGMMSDDDLGELTNTTDRSAFEKMWLTMMIAHHQGAIDMARTELADGEYQPALDLAQSIIESQSAEIGQMKQMLQDSPAS